MNVPSKHKPSKGRYVFAFVMSSLVMAVAIGVPVDLLLDAAEINLPLVTDFI